MNDAMIVILQIEHIDAVNNIDQMLAVPGISSLVMFLWESESAMTPEVRHFIRERKAKVGAVAGGSAGWPREPRRYAG